eukprot:TRINITY_DN30782_c0_g1_i1.p1 TRINITY_DN30782_c0_g1~~TRINITY_DN30782_c0_g1_i1.p1  ORF type:complete len:559 (-),score=59.18 TRINITY_DN30782_c0_g1_i1:188-1864(-)
MFTLSIVCLVSSCLSLIFAARFKSATTSDAESSINGFHSHGGLDNGFSDLVTSNRVSRNEIERGDMQPSSQVHVPASVGEATTKAQDVPGTDQSQGSKTGADEPGDSASASTAAKTSEPPAVDKPPAGQVAVVEEAYAASLEPKRFVLPGIGWGVCPGTRFMRPFCRTEDRLSGLVWTKSSMPESPSVSLYQSKNDVRASLSLRSGLSTSSINAGITEDFADSIVARFDAQFSSGQKLLHVQYDFPLHMVSLKDPLVACAPNFEIYSNILQNASDDDTMDTFISTHGTKVVHAAVLGGRLDIFRVQSANVKGIDLSFLSEVGSARSIGMGMEMHLVVLGGQWAPMRLKQTELTLSDAIADWVKTIEEQNSLAVLHTTTMSMSLVFPHDVRQYVEASINRITGKAHARIRALNDLVSTAHDLRTAKAGVDSMVSEKLEGLKGSVFPNSIGARVLHQLQRLNVVMQSIQSFCGRVVDYMELCRDRHAGDVCDSSPPMSHALTCRDLFRWSCKLRLPEQDANIPHYDFEIPMNMDPDVLQSLRDGVGTVYERCRAVEASLP